MNGAIGDVLPLAIGVAISPVPIIAVVLLLLAPRAKAASAAFAVAWVAGIVASVTVFTVIAATAGLVTSGGALSTASCWVRIALGVLLLLLGLRQWQAARGEAAQLPKWMATIDSVTPVKALGLGVLLAVVNPKNLLLCGTAGVAVGGGDLSTGQSVVTIAIFTVLASSTVSVPVLGYAVASERMQQPLDALKVWMVDNNAAVMAVLLLVLGVATIGKGIGGLG